MNPDMVAFTSDHNEVFTSELDAILSALHKVRNWLKENGKKTTNRQHSTSTYCNPNTKPTRHFATITIMYERE